MSFNIFPWRSLKTRVTLFTLAIFVLSIWSLATYASRMLREDMQRLLGEQQFSTVSVAAAVINDELAERLRALEKVAQSITPAMLGNAAILQAYLQDRSIFDTLFNGGVIAYRLDGTAIADSMPTAGRIGVNYMDIDTVAIALKEGKSNIGRPVIGKKLNAPVFGMTAPIRAAQGTVIGALAGVVNLGRPNFLDKLTQSQYGKTGGYILISVADRLVITATDKSRIMQPLAPPDASPQTDRFLAGFEGYAVYVNPRGQEVLNASKRITLANWNVAATLPTEEAFAPIRVMQQRMLLVAIALTLLAGGLTWWLLRRELAPMLTTAKALAAMLQLNEHPQPLPITRPDEIGDLIGGFNRLFADLGQRTEALRQSEEKYRVLFEAASDAIFLMQSDRFVDCNDRTLVVFGCQSRDQIVGRPPYEFSPPLQADGRNSRELAIEKINSALQGQPQFFEWMHTKLDGTLFPAEVSLTAVKYGQQLMLLAMVRDITERKQMEEQIRQLAFFDPLTNLPNRRLLSDRLSQTFAASKRSGHYGALMFLDLDDFKALNDTHGHAVGDLLLIQAANRLKGCVREGDTVARLGGDEFVVVAGDLSADKVESTTQAGLIAEKIRSSLAEPYLLATKHDQRPDSGVEHRCTVTIGVVVFSEREGSQDDFLRWADAAMYQAKEADSNSIQFYESKT